MCIVASFKLSCMYCCSFLVCIVVVLSCLVCIVVVFLCVLLSSYVYFLYCVCIAVMKGKLGVGGKGRI